MNVTRNKVYINGVSVLRVHLRAITIFCATNINTIPLSVPFLTKQTQIKGAQEVPKTKRSIPSLHSGCFGYKTGV